MILWFLRIFAAFRELEASVESLRADLESLRGDNELLMNEKVALSDRLDITMQDKERLWTVTEEALAAERFAYKTFFNHEVQRRGGGIPYPEAHSLPAAAVPQVQKTGPVGRAGRIMTSQMLAQRSRANLVDYFASSAAEAPPPEQQ